MTHLQSLILWTNSHQNSKRNKGAFADPLESPEWEAFAPLIRLWGK